MFGGRIIDVEYIGKLLKIRLLKFWSEIKLKKVCDKKLFVII